MISSGFIMVQESVYSKLALNSTVANAVVTNVKKHKPDCGLVQLLVVTEKQYNRMEVIVGESNSEVIDSDERIVIL